MTTGEARCEAVRRSIVLRSLQRAALVTIYTETEMNPVAAKEALRQAIAATDEAKRRATSQALKDPRWLKA